MSKNDIRGDNHDNVITGTAGSDRIFALAGDDQVFGGDGADQIFGGAGRDALEGGAGADRLYASDAGSAESGGNRLEGGDGNDHLYGGAGDLLKGDGGNDSLSGGAGATLLGGAGLDYVFLDLAQDDHTFDGGFGHLARHGSLRLEDGAVVREAESGGFSLTSFNDVARLGRDAVHSALYGGAGDDLLRGGDNADTLSGGDGGDSLLGGRGGDSLAGQAGDNLLNGGDGVDTIESAGGADTIVTGKGADRVILVGNDVSTAAHPDHITDLTAADVIDLGRVDADTTSTHKVTFHLVDAFDGHAGEIVVSYDAATDQTYIQGDTDGDKAADLVIIADGDHHNYTNFDFQH